MWSLSLLALWATPALADPVSIALPPSESAELWAEPLALADLVPGQAEGAASWISPAGDRWEVVVRDVSGEHHELTVEVPSSQAEREALAHLIASIARPIVVPAIAQPPVAPAPVPTPQPEPGRPVAAPEPREPLAPLPQAARAAEAVPEAEIARPQPADESAWPLEGWARLAGGFAWRDAAAAPAGSVFAGLGLGPARIGLGVAASGPHPIPTSGGLTWTHFETVLGLGFAIPQGPVLGLGGGLARRTYDREASVVRATAQAELGWRVPLGANLDLMPLVLVEIDPGVGGLRRTTVRVDGQSVGELSPTAVRLQLAVAPHG